MNFPDHARRIEAAAFETIKEGKVKRSIGLLYMINIILRSNMEHFDIKNV